MIPTLPERSTQLGEFKDNSIVLLPPLGIKILNYRGLLQRLTVFLSSMSTKKLTLRGSFSVTALKRPTYPSTYLSLSLSPLTSGNHWSFSFSVVFLSSNCLLVGLIQYVAFSDWLFPLSNIHLRLNYYLRLNSPFLFIVE